MKKLFIAIVVVGVLGFGYWYKFIRVPMLPNDLDCQALNIALDLVNDPKLEAKILKKNGNKICKNGLEDCVADAHSITDADKAKYEAFWKSAVGTDFTLDQILTNKTKNICYEKYLAFYMDNNAVKMKISDEYQISNDTTYFSFVLFKGIEKKHKIKDPKTKFTFAKNGSEGIVFRFMTTDGKAGSVSVPYNYTIKPRYNPINILPL